MGGTSNKEQQHQERANQASVEDLQQLQSAKQISGRLYHITKNIYEHCIQQQFNQLANDFKTLTYDLPDCQLPLCLKKTKRYYLCRTCFDEEVCVCEGCFQVHKHANHNYVLAETDYSRICCCGNAEIIADPPSCEAHRFKEPMVNEQSTDLFTNQLKYLVKLALPLAHNHSQVKISQKFRSSFIFHLLAFIKSKIANNNVTAQLVEEIFLELSQYSVDRHTVLEEIICSQEDEDNITLITEIVSCLVKSKCKKDRLTKVYFNMLLNNHPQSLLVLKTLADSGFKPSSFPKTYQRFFQKPQNRKFYLQNMDTKNLNKVCQKHEKLTKQLGDILLHPNRSHLLLKILKKTKFTELLNFQSYYLANNQALSNINKINIHFSLLAINIIRILSETEEGLDIIKRNMSDIYQQINHRQAVTFDRSLQRTFSFAVFTLFKHNLPKKAQLQKLLGTQIEPVTANILLIQSFDFKNSFTKQYHDLIVKGDVLKLQGKISFAMAELIAADQLFVKLIANCLSEDYLFREYFELKLGEELHKDELSLKNVRQVLRKMTELFKQFELPLQNNMAQLVLSANSRQKGKESEIVLYNLLIGYENILSAKFKAIADQFITCEEKIIQFIKHNSLVQNKKIKVKPSSNIPILPLSPDSEYYFEHLQNQAIQKLLQFKLGQVEISQCYQNIFNSKTLKSSIKIWQKCASIIQNVGFDAKKHEKELIATVLSLCNLFFGTKLPVIKQLVQKISAKLISPNSKIQLYLKYVVQAKNGEEKQKQTSDKKRQMLNALKQKQKNALKNFKLQEKCNIDLQCIFCRNSIEGEPYLLGHFRYNNFYSQKILEVKTPFMEFTTCGHSAHEKCLIEMHKGDFRIWYPCILCKSITNILLPIANTQLNEEKRLQKILDFLKNFAANYTFFFESNKQLVEFDLNDIIGVYKLLFRTMAYELTIYPIANFSYFERSQLPILKFIFDLLVFSYKKLRNLPLGGQYIELKANNDFNNIFNYHKYQLEAFITGNQSNLALQRKIDVHRDRIPEELTLLFDQIYEYLTDERDRIDYELKQTSFKDALKVLIFKPPQDLTALRKMKSKCATCSNLDQSFQICLLCERSFCSNCKDIRKVHALQIHLGETVFICGYNGKYTYIHEQLIAEYNSIYVDYLGHEANDKKIISPNEYTISQSGWAKIVSDIICNRLHKEIMRLQA